MIPSKLRSALYRLRRNLSPKYRFHGCPDLCGSFDFEAINKKLTASDLVGKEYLYDWSGKQTTPDQRRIESVLEQLDYEGARVLQIGIGNSEFAMRWGDKLAGIIGTTISPAELERANSLNIDAYNVFLVNKYSPEMRTLDGGFDFIIDNNPNFSPCCKYHFFVLWDACRLLLRPGGKLITDIGGLGWLPPFVDRRWVLDDKDLQWLSDAFGFSVTRAGEAGLVRLLTKLDDK